MIVTKQPVLRKFWYPVVRASTLLDRPMAFTLLGENIVLWKAKDGSIAPSRSKTRRSLKVVSSTCRSPSSTTKNFICCPTGRGW